MVENSNFEYWVSKIHSLGNRRFEELCYEIIRGYGFMDRYWLQSSYDDGRDIEAQKDNITYLFECKCYGSGISKNDIAPFLYYAGSRSTINELYILSNKNVTPPGVRFIDEMCLQNTDLKLKNITYKTDKAFQEWLFYCPSIHNIMLEFFAMDVIPPIYLKFKNIFTIEIEKGLIDLNTFNSLSELDKLKRLFEIIINHKMDNIDKAKIYQKMALIAIINNDLEFTKKCVKEGLKIISINRDLLLYNGYIFSKLADWPKALAEFQKVISNIDDHDKFALLNKAICLKNMGEIKKSDMIYKMLDNFHPDFILSKQHKLNLELNTLKLKGDFCKEVKFNEYKQEIELYFKDIDQTAFNYNLSLLYLAIKDYNLAIQHINIAIKGAPYNFELYNQKGIIYERYRSEDISEESYIKSTNCAIDAFKLALRYNSNSTFVLGNLILCLNNLEDIESLLSDKPDYIKDDPEIRQRLLEQKLNRDQNPIEDISKLFKAYPKLYHVRYSYIVSLIKIKNFRLANQEVDKLLKEDNSNLKLWILKLIILENTDNTEKELGYCKKQIEKYDFPLKSNITFD